MLYSRVVVFFLVVIQIVLFLIQIVLEIKFLLAISYLGPIVILILFLIELLELSFILFLVGLLGEVQLFIHIPITLNLKHLIVLVAIVPKLLAMLLFLYLVIAVAC